MTFGLRERKQLKELVIMNKFAMQFLYQLRRLYHRVRKPVTLGSRALVVQQEQVLLVQLTYYPGWFLPGGGVDKGESFQTAATRELFEECGIVAEDSRLLGVYLNRHRGKVDHVAVYTVTKFTGTPSCHDVREIAEVRFFHKDSLPAELLPGHRRRIEEYFGKREAHHEW